MISILVPTFGRPQRLREMVESVYSTAARPAEVDVVVRVAQEDSQYQAYLAAPPTGARMLLTEGAKSYGLGIEFLQGHARGDVLCAASDDVLFRTAGWDAVVEAHFANNPFAIAYANNGLDREKCEHFFCTRRWIDVVGYMVWPEFRHFCVDQWVEEIARDLGTLHFLREVVVEHMHRKYRKAPNDATYDMVRGNTGVNDADNALFKERAPERAAALERLRAAIT